LESSSQVSVVPCSHDFWADVHSGYSHISVISVSRLKRERMESIVSLLTGFEEATGGLPTMTLASSTCNDERSFTQPTLRLTCDVLSLSLLDRNSIAARMWLTRCRKPMPRFASRRTFLALETNAAQKCCKRKICCIVQHQDS
jgi:hypothetical protein